MRAYLFDTETDGLLPEVTKLHSNVLRNIETGAVTSCAAAKGYTPLAEGLSMLADADLVVGHNVIKYDVPVIQKLHPSWRTRAVVRDTLLLSRLLWPEVKDKDFRRVEQPGSTFPKQMIGRYSLEAWGHRLGIFKGDYGKTADWKVWTKEMQDYCEQDITVTAKLWELIQKKNYSERAIELEHRFQDIIWKQEQVGVGFDTKAAQKLQAEMSARRQELEEQLQLVFKPWYASNGTATPKRSLNFKDKQRASTVAGCEYTKVERITFNPASRDHISNRLKVLRGWEPAVFTGEGKPKVDETVLESLPYPEVALLIEYLALQKALGQLSEGKQAWMKLERNGRIYGRVETVGAVTRRCTHQGPNLAQVPSVKLEKVDGKEVPILGSRGGYGHECRQLFIPKKGYLLVGADASGLELRFLGHYMARYDEGRYVKLILEGDVHTANKEAAGLYNRGSPGAKTFIYAFLYGAGDEKLGTIVVDDARLAGKDPFADIETMRLKYASRWSAAVRMLRKQGRKPTKELVATIVMGGLLKERFLAKTPALKRLREDVSKKAKKNNTLRAIDGGILQVRHSHAALNTLLQSAGAIVVKQATNLLWDKLSTRGYTFGKEVSQVLHIHDEVQLEVKEELADEVGKLAVECIKEAGESFDLRCPLDGAYKVGRSWADTH